MRPAIGVSKPIASFKSDVLPEPLGPRRMVGNPALIESVTSRRTCATPAVNATFSKRIGSVVGRSRTGLSRMTFGPAPYRPGQRIDRQDHADQHEPEPNGKRKVALRCL